MPRRRLDWNRDPHAPTPRGGRNPYIQAAVTNAIIGAVVIVVAAATGGSIVRAVVAVLLAWAAGTAYASWRIRSRERAERGDGPGDL